MEKPSLGKRVSPAKKQQVIVVLVNLRKEVEKIIEMKK